jgi:hypothetical protein
MNFSFIATDAVFPSFNCTLMLDGYANKLNPNTINNTITPFNVPFLSAMTHNWTIRCSDAINNTGSGPLRRFTIDTLPPAISFIRPTPSSNSVQHLSYIPINVSANDTTLANVTINLYNASRALINSTTSPTSFLANFTNLPDGLYFFNATAYDRAGHNTSTQTWNVSLDNVPPLITVVSPLNNTIYNTSIVLLNVSVTEAHPYRTWYSLGAYNTTYLSPISIFFASGPHTLSVWSNDSSGLISSAYVNFTTP